ncbi:hypothetical protein [Ramlibacter sp.]|uniref:hypothetical protein n=1 Tax=Ramlibacter sp. TaxID=1917967 RepID=UPI003D0AF6F8
MGGGATEGKGSGGTGAGGLGAGAGTGGAASVRRGDTSGSRDCSVSGNCVVACIGTLGSGRVENTGSRCEGRSTSEGALIALGLDALFAADEIGCT